MRSKATGRTCLDSVDRQRPPVDAPAGARAKILVVVTQMPDQGGDFVVGDGPVMRDADDPAQRVVGVSGRIHLTDDRVFGAMDGGQRGHRGADAVSPVVLADRLE
jgi:hypothetical protein